MMQMCVDNYSVNSLQKAQNQKLYLFEEMHVKTKNKYKNIQNP